jgi:hypothetical protein
MASSLASNPLQRDAECRRDVLIGTLQGCCDRCNDAIVEFRADPKTGAIIEEELND